MEGKRKMAFSNDNASQLNHIGTEKFGRLRRVMLHRPEEALKLIHEDNLEFFLFDKVPDVDMFLDEHKRYEALLKSFEIEVHLLADHVANNITLMKRLPNLAYMHDTAVISSNGSILSKMSSLGRCHEEIVVGEALASLGIPNLYEPAEGEAFEGCLLLSPSTVFIADTERHSRKSIEKVISFLLRYFSEVIYAQIPEERRFMHPDMVLNRVTDRLMIYYPPAFLKTFHVTGSKREEIEIKAYMASRHIDMIPISDAEQKRWGSSFVPLEPDTLILYDISLEQRTINLLEREGVRLITFHPDALLAGGGSLRCLTLRIWREA